MDYDNLIDMFISLLCANEDTFFNNGVKISTDICTKLDSYIKTHGSDTLVPLHLFSHSLANLLSGLSDQIIEKFIPRLSNNDNSIKEEAKESINYALKFYPINVEHICNCLLNGIVFNPIIIKEIIIDWLYSLVLYKKQDFDLLNSNHRLIEWLNEIKLENNDDEKFLNKLSLVINNLTTLLIPVITSENTITNLPSGVAVDQVVNTENLLTENLLIIDNIVEINTNIIDNPENNRALETLEIDKDKEINKLRNELRTMHNKLQKSSKLEKENKNETNNITKASTSKIYKQNLIADNLDCQKFKEDSELNIFFKQKLLELLGNVWFNKGIKFQMSPINKKIFYYICKNNKFKSIKCPSRCIAELNLDTYMGSITHNAKSHNVECQRAMDLEKEKSKIYQKKKEEFDKVAKLKKELKILKKKKAMNKSTKIQIIRLKTASSKNSANRNESAQNNCDANKKKDDSQLKYELRTRLKMKTSLNRDNKEENDSDSSSSLDESIEINETQLTKNQNHQDKTSNCELTEGLINEKDLALLAEEFDNVLDKSSVPTKHAENGEDLDNLNQSISSDENADISKIKTRTKRKRKTSSNDENEPYKLVMNKTMPQRSKSVLSDKYVNNIVAENVDCSSIKTESEYNEYFKQKLTELLSSNWTINGNARFISVENKIIHYYACVKNKTKSISCPLKCIIELDLNTKLARFMKNGEHHNHDQNTCGNRLTLTQYQKNIIAENIDCQNCITPKDYDLFFQQRLSTLLSHNWLKQNDTKINEKDNKSTHYYVCTKNKNKTLKCPAKCFIEVDLSTNQASVMYNGKEHNHLVDPFKPKTQPKFSCYLNNIIAQNICCKYCTDEKEYNLLFKLKLNEILGSNWDLSNQPQKKFKTSEFKKTFYYYCTQKNPKGVKCSMRSIVELDELSNTAKIMHNGRNHTHN